jgi:hypothetical protein
MNKALCVSEDGTWRVVGMLRWECGSVPRVYRTPQVIVNENEGSIPYSQCCGSALVSMRIWIQYFTSMWIRIQGAKPMRIHADPDPYEISKKQIQQKFVIVPIGK